MLLGTCGVGQSSFASLDVTQDNGSVLCVVRRPSAAMQDVGGDTLSTVRRPSVDNPDSRASSFMTEHDTADKLDSTSVQHDSAMSRRSSAAVDLNCSVMDTMSRNRVSKTRRTSLNDDVVRNFSSAGVHDSGCVDTAEQCQRVAWKRTKSYDMSAHAVTVL